MIQAHIDKRSAVPWWAAFGAPLIGVPLLVGLLALGSMHHPKAGAVKDAETGYATEQTEALQSAAVQLPPVSVKVTADSHS